MLQTDFYEEHGEDFFLRTVELDMSDHYGRFLAYVPTGGRILDAGCGSGRDSLAFLARNYSVTAFDASTYLVDAASQLTGLEVARKRFEEMEYEEEFDGIWASASLLHVRRSGMPGVFQRCVRALRPGGVWYLSFKYGERERIKDGRLFTDLTEGGLRSVLTELDEVELLEAWVTGDVRHDRKTERWLNAIVKRQAHRTRDLESDDQPDAAAAGSSGLGAA